MDPNKGGPLPSVALLRQLAAKMMPPLMDCYSGELTGTVYNRPLGVANMSGRVSDVFLSVERCGQDDDAALNLSGEVYINGTSCLTTRPSIGYVSGEASQHKTTRITGDTAIVQAMVDPDNNSVTAGDIISYDFLIDSQASPNVKLRNPCLVVIFEPAMN